MTLDTFGRNENPCRCNITRVAGCKHNFYRATPGPIEVLVNDFAFPCVGGCGCLGTANVDSVTTTPVRSPSEVVPTEISITLQKWLGLKF